MGGTQIDTFHLAEWQHDHFDVDVIMGNDGPLRRACESAGIPASIISMQNRFISPLGDLRALGQLMRQFRSTRPDLVHTHSSKAGLLGRVAAALSGVPVIAHTFHVLPYHDRQPKPLRYALIELERILGRITDHLVSVAETLRMDVVERGICRPEAVTTIGSGIDFHNFPTDREETRRQIRTSLEIDLHSSVVISVANLERRKRYDIFVDAAARLVRTHPDTRFLIAGTGEMRDAIDLQIRQAGLQDCVSLLGYRSDVPALLAASDIFVQTSQLEGLSRSLIEAMYAGLAVVATDTDGTRELIGHGITGLVIPEGDVSALSDALSSLLAEPALRDALGSAGKKAVGERWSVEAMGRTHDALYEQLLTLKAPARRD